MKILILGGTGEARALAEALIGLRHDVTTALAGRTQSPLPIPGNIRTGGFGGAEGLREFIVSEGFDHIFDATHPYAEQISRNAILATQSAGRPLVRLLRPAWEEQPGADWLRVADAGAAAVSLPSGAMALLTTGHRGLEDFLSRENCMFVLRLIEKPEAVLPDNVRLVIARPPYSVEEESALMRTHAITHLVTKNSGGAQTTAKLVAAQRLGVKIVVIDRPQYDPGVEVTNVADALKAL
ncbi:cobalt-precorrin-6A reductase [Devosia rhodophyticola]|uniref:Cobalt-precorrin-6A reductase n=1 Tax=Devosia rhodophyticola TaxID=3026423 RepID=A0ABY7YYY0_9HYPH|nr:cobalt-precorrin-6A reductase [Devosia rhodophyticola]WDR06590.1 cobalt-precorrin-6A reductase [Devosia rhodophyticola]